MKLLTKIFVLFLFAGLIFSSCKKENVDEIIVTEDPDFVPEIVEVNNLVNALQSNSSTGLDLDCITINFPFELALESGANITINSNDDFQNALTGEGPNHVVDFVFPLFASDEDGVISQFDNNNTLGATFASCIPDYGWNLGPENGDLIPAFLFDDLCFDLVYPVNLEDADGNPYTANDEVEFIDLVATVDELFFVLPITIIDSNGNSIFIETIDDFFDAVFDCTGISPPVAVGNGSIIIEGFGCNQLAYPFDIQNNQGMTTTVNDENEYVDILLSGDTILLVYPFDLIDGDGNTLTINNGDELIDALNACGGFFIEITPTDICSTPAHVLLFFNQSSFCGYTIDFPLQLEATGITYDINVFSDYFVPYNNHNLDEIEIIYPITVTLTDDQSTVTFNEDQDICDFIETQCN